MTLEIVKRTTLSAAGYNNSPVNAQTWGSGGTATAAGEELIPFYTQSAGQIVLASINPTTGVVTLNNGAYTAVTTPNTNPSDSHCVAVAVVDGDGVCHCWFGMHAVPMKYWKGADATDRLIDHQSTPMQSGSTFESSATYPYPLVMKSGNLVAFFRDGASGNGDEICARYLTTANGGSGGWLEVKLIDGLSVNESPYLTGRITYDPSIGTYGRIWICWNWCAAPTNADQHNLEAMWSDDEGVTWNGAKTGAAITLPITRDGNGPTDCRIRTQAISTGLINVGVSCVGPDGSLVTVNTWSKNVDSASQFFVTFKNELGNWESAEIGLASSTFSYVTTAIADIPNPYPFFWGPVRYHRGKFYFICRIDELDTGGVTPGLWCYVADGPYPRTWTRYRLADNLEYGACSPAWNEEVWRASKRLAVLHQEAYEQPGGAVTGATTIERVTFAPLQELTDTMASAKLTPFARSVLCNKFRNSSLEDYAPTATHTVHLYQSGVEVSGGSYVPVSIANNGTTYTITGRTVRIAIGLSFGTSSGSWGTPDEYRIKDANSNTLARIPITTPTAIPSGKLVTASSGTIIVTADAGTVVDSQATALLSWIFGAVSYTPDASRKYQFFQGDPRSGGTPLGAQVTVTQAGLWTFASDGVCSTSSGISITDQTAATYLAEYDPTGATLRAAQALPAPPSGNVIAAGMLKTSFT